MQIVVWKSTASTLSTVINHADSGVELYSIYSLDAQFYPLFFHPLTIPPKSNISVTILYLPQVVNFAETILQLNTSSGEVEYEVGGVGIASPYHSTPFLQLKAYIGAPTQEQAVHVFNPYHHPLYIFEIFTLENFLIFKENAALGTLTDNKRGDVPSYYSVIEPGETKDLISFSFNTKMPAGFYRGFLHIQTNIDTLILPIEIDLVPGGLSLSRPDISFGIFTRRNERKTVDLSFWNHGLSDVMITNIIPLQTETRLGIEMETFPIVRPNEMEPIRVARLTFVSKSMDRIQGKLLITTNDSQNAYAAFEVAYTGIILQGRISMASNNATIFLSSTQTLSLHLYNRFNVPIIIRDIKVSTCPEFVRWDTSAIKGSISAPNQAFPPFLLLMNKSDNVESEIKSKTCWIELTTNASFQRLPLHFVSGKLSLEAFEANALTMKEETATSQTWKFAVDSLNLYSPRDVRFIISNTNPVSLPFRLSQSSSDVCLCRESAWPTGHGDRNRDLTFLRNVSSRALISGSLSLKERFSDNISAQRKCACHSSKNASSTIFHLKPGYNTLFSLFFSFSENLCENVFPRTEATKFKNFVTLGAVSQTISFELEHSFNENCYQLLQLLENNSELVLGINDTFNASLITYVLHGANKLTHETTMAIDSAQIVPSLSFFRVTHSFETQPLIQNNSIEILSRANVKVRLHYLRIESEHDYIFGFKFWLCLNRIVRELKLDDSSSEVVDILDYMEEFRKDTNKYNQISEISFKYLQLRRLWFRRFPNGIPLPSNLTLVIRARDHQYSHSLHPPSLQMAAIPRSISVLKVVGNMSAHHTAAIFIEVHNPFVLDMDVTLAEDVDYLPRTLKLWSTEDSFRPCSQDQVVPLISPSNNAHPEVYVSSIFRVSPNSGELLEGSHCAFEPRKLEPQNEWTSRFKGVAWRVKPGKKRVIGPIEFIPDENSNADRIYNKMFYVGNSLTGYHPIDIAIMTKPSKLVVYGISHISRSLSPLLNHSTVLDVNTTIDVKFEKVNLGDTIQLELGSSPHDLIVSHVRLNGLTWCEYYSSSTCNESLFSFQHIPRNKTRLMIVPLLTDCDILGTSVLVEFYESSTLSSVILLGRVKIDFTYSNEFVSFCSKETTGIMKAKVIVLLVILCVALQLWKGIITDFKPIKPKEACKQESSVPNLSPFKKILSLNRKYGESRIYEVTELQDFIPSSSAITLVEELIADSDYSLPTTHIEEVLPQSPTQEILPLKVDSDNPIDFSEESDEEKVALNERLQPTKPNHQNYNELTNDEIFSSEELDEEIFSLTIQDCELSGRRIENWEDEDRLSANLLQNNHFFALREDPPLLAQPTLNVSIGAPPGLARSSAASSISQPLHTSLNPTHLSLSWLYSEKETVNTDQIWSSINQSQNLSFPTTLYSEDFDQTISKLSENLNELLDDDNDRYTNVDSWQQMNAPPHPANFFGSGGFFDFNSDSMLEESLEKEREE
eukprot:CAMPEP_0173139182 /NCGR_PEP_ID=MMETSP1105-20130129/4113_1 /TAXON_ID=2985 /ORGANISM="Ochromonas sp., Strain BG-1" /LENGTH=1473 /DNA_ID=CAMNT_0014051879 /DNA_START=117 /DNA_END=4538 /DNA_ORIENTATION=+